jgi:hypothetical protein
VVIVVALVAVAGLSAAGLWWRMSRYPVQEGPTGFERASAAVESEGDLFVLSPSDAAPTRSDRPPRSISLVRLALVIAVSTLVLVALASAIAFLLKVQLDRYFTSGG